MIITVIKIIGVEHLLNDAVPFDSVAPISLSTESLIHNVIESVMALTE